MFRKAAKASSARMELGDQLRLTAAARRDFLPQVSLAAQSERADGALSSGSALQTTWKFRTGVALSAAIGRSVPVQPTLLPGQADRMTTQSQGLSSPCCEARGSRRQRLTSARRTWLPAAQGVISTKHWPIFAQRLMVTENRWSLEK